MIFLYKKSKKSISDYQKAAEAFSFQDMEELVYRENISGFENLQAKFNDNKRIYPDLISAIYRKLYENGLTKQKRLTDAILACSYFLQNKGFKFLGFIRRDDDLKKINGDVDYVTKWDFDSGNFKLKGSAGKSKQHLSDIFDIKLFKDSFNLFFVAGSQSIEMLDSRIKKCATVISSLVKEQFIAAVDTRVILSGLNNAKVEHSKVQFSNESLVMKNLLIHKLVHYSDAINENFLVDNVESEIKSRDTIENIEELFKKLDEVTSLAEVAPKKQMNLFIVSSSFHLIQLSVQLLKKEQSLREELKSKGKKLNLFLVGSENPLHSFKIYDKHYIKLLIHEVVYRNFKFCK